VTVLTGRPVPETSTIAAVVMEGSPASSPWPRPSSSWRRSCCAGQTWVSAAPRPKSLRLFWLPGLYVAAFLSAGLAAGLPPAGVLLILLANALLGSFSER
jgi:hypothetical protein